MELEEAIKILSELHGQCCQADSIFCTDTTGARCEAVDMAISALEKQIPKNLIAEGDGYADGSMVYDSFYCPSCDHCMEWDEVEDYCPSCGQKICLEDE